MSEARAAEDSRSGVRRIWLNGALSILVILTLLAGAFIIGERQRRMTLFERRIVPLAGCVQVGHPAEGVRWLEYGGGSETEGNGLWSMAYGVTSFSTSGEGLAVRIEAAWTGEAWKVVDATISYREPGASGDTWTMEQDITEVVAGMGRKDTLFVPSLEVFTAQEE